MHSLENGIRVTWAYRHHIGRSYTVRLKHGRYIGLVRYRPGGIRGPLKFHPYLVHVLFDGNRTWSKVSVEELKLEKPQEGTKSE